MDDSLDYYTKEYVPKAFGLVNNGVICYFNSLIQSLMSCTCLNKYLISGAGDTDNMVIKQYVDLYTETIDNSNIKSAISIWEALRDYVMKTGRDKSRLIFASGGQQCADEALKLLLESMGDNVLSRFTVKYTNFVVCGNCGGKSDAQRDYNSFIKLIGNEISYVKNPANVEVWQKQFQQYILKHYGVVEDYRCENCGDKKVKKRMHELRMLNEVIVVVLAKYGLKRMIYYPARLSFPKIGGGKMEYILVSQIDHFGSISSGHYTSRSVRKDTNGKFYIAHLNDESLKPLLRGGFIPNENSYILFYHLVK